MENLNFLLIAVAAAAALFAVLENRRRVQLGAALESANQDRVTAQDQLDKLKREGREKSAEFENVKKRLAEAKAKLKRHQKDAHEASSKKKQKKDESSSTHVVEVSNQELEARHRAKVEKLEVELKKAEARANKLEQDAEAKRAQAKALASDMGQSEDAPIGADTLQAMKDGAKARERELKKELKAIEGRVKAAQRRASNHQALYNVLRGQVELLESKLALYRQRYEGAKRPDELVEAKAQAAPAASEKADSTPEAAVPSVDAPPELDAKQPAMDTKPEGETSETEVSEAQTAAEGTTTSAVGA